MNIAIVVNSLKTGGMERVAVNLAFSFHEEGYATDLIYLKNIPKALPIKNNSLPIHLFDLKKGVFKTGIGLLWFVTCKVLNVFLKKTFPLFFAYAEAKIFRRKLRLLETKNGKPFDLIIFRGQGTFAHIWPLQDPRFIFVCESIQNNNMYGKLSSWVFTNLYKNRNVVTVSVGAMDSFIDLITHHGISPNKVKQLNNPNDLEQIKVDSEKSVSYLNSQHKPFILGLGRLVKGKNFPLLIDAYAYAREHYKLQHNLIIVGEGKERQNIEIHIKNKQLEKCVFLVGNQSNPFPWYKHAELFVLSSKAEGLGMVLLEALSCQTKVVSTDCKGGVRQIMNGLLEPFLSEESPKSLADKIVFALEHEEDQTFTRFIDQTLDKFSGKEITKQYIEEFSVQGYTAH